MGERTDTRRLTAITAVVAGAMAAGTIAHFAIGAVGPQLIAELDLSRARLGTVTTGLFVVAAIASPMVGRFVDRLPTGGAHAALFALTALALGVFAAAPSYAWLFPAMAVAGMTQAMVNPLTNRAVLLHAPLQRQGRVMGLKQSGVQAGGVLAGTALPALVVLANWRVALLAVGAASLVAAALAARTLGADPAPPSPTTEPAGPRPQARTDGLVAALTVYAVLMGAAASVIGTYLAVYGNEAVGLQPAVAGTLIGVVGGVGVAARIGIGVLAETRSHPRGSLGLLAGCAAVGAAATALIAAAAPLAPALVWAGAGLFGVSVGWNTVAMLAVVREAGPAATGRASGVVMSGFFGGFILAPPAFGLLADITGAYGIGWTGLTICQALALGVALMLLRARRAGSAAAAPPGSAAREGPAPS